MSKQPERFEVVHEQKSLGDGVRILRDVETGVCYVQAAWGSAGGLTPLLDADGKPVVQR